MKLIDADRMKMMLNNKTALGKFTEPYSLEFMLIYIDTQKEVMLSCPKCHGKGKYGVPIIPMGLDDDEESGAEWHKCLICKGTGKITIDAYEDYQDRCRGKK